MHHQTLLTVHHTRLYKYTTYQFLHIIHHPMPHKSLLDPEDSTGLAHVPCSCIDMASLEDFPLLILILNEMQDHFSL